MKLITEYPIWYLLLCLALGLIYAISLYYKTKTTSEFSKTLKTLVFILRTTFVAGIAALLLGVLIKSVSQEELKPLIIFGQDNSESLVTAPDSNFYLNEYPKKVDSLLSELSQSYDVRRFTFGSDTKESTSLTYDEKQTDISQFLKEIESRFSNMNLGGVILASDGLYNRGINPLYSNQNLNTPIYTIPMGDPLPKKDLTIKKINFNEITYLDNRFPVEIAVESFMCNGEVSDVQIFKNGKLVAEEELFIESENEFEKKVFILEADEIGTIKYTCKLKYLNDEASYQNNTKNFYVEVIDSKQKIGIIYFRIHPDVAAIKESISKNQNYDVEVIAAKDLQDISRLNAFDLVVLIDPISERKNIALFKSIYDSDIPQLNIYGGRSKFGQVNRNLGFRNVGSGGKTNAVLGKIHEGFSLFKLDQLEQNKIQDFPPLTVPFGRYTVSNNTSVLMHQRIGTLNTKYPLVIFSELNKKMGSILGEGIWRWRIHNFDKYENHNLFDDFISKTIQFLALKEDKRKFRVEVDHKFLENQSIEFKSELYNKNYELINDPEVELSIRDDNDKIFKYSFNRTGDFYTVDIGHLPEGRYTYFAKTSLNGEELNGSGSFVVSSIQLEKTEVTANHIMMRSLSKRTGGLSIAPEQLVNLGDSLQRRGDLKPVIYEKTDFENVMDLEWLLFLIILIFSFEWMLRKQNGIF